MMPITSIHWWGCFDGWMGPGPPPVEPDKWRIGFWSNVADPDPGDANTFSRPDMLLHQIEVDANRVEFPMISYWKLDEGTGSQVNDSFDGNNGTKYGASWTTGQVGPALYFHGGGQWASGSDYVRIPHSSSLDITGPFTVEAWIKATGTDKYHMIVDKFYGSSVPNQHGFSFYLTGGDLRLSIYSGPSGSENCFVFNNDLRDNTWHHVAGLWDGSYIKLYIDGVLGGKRAYDKPPSSTTQYLAIGKRPCGWLSAFPGLHR